MPSASAEIKPPSNTELLDVLLTMPGSTYGAYSRFHSYSPRNRAWFFMQGVDPQPVATFQGWRNVNRHVVKGASAKYVLRPITVKLKEQDPATGQEVERPFTRFKPVKAIFALSDTVGEELPPLETPQWSMERALGRLAIEQVPFETFDANTQGYSYERRIAINPVAVNPLKTGVHELAHVCLGHTMPSEHAEYVQHRGLKEFQAEATAYLTLHELDAMDEVTDSRSRAYCQGWLEGEHPSDRSIAQVFAVHDEILHAGFASASEAAA